MRYWKLVLKKGADLQHVAQELSAHAIQQLVSVEGAEVELIVESDAPLPDFPFVKSVLPAETQIDWESQWEHFSPCYQDGRFSLDLHDYGMERKVWMEPGPGFGDLSHPTTRLMLHLMGEQRTLMKEAHVLDIGSGSGVLSLAAVLFGAKEVVGIDIDPFANRHARKNARINGMKKVRFLLPRKKIWGSKPIKKVVLLNMIFGEQKQAVLPFFEELQGTHLLSSGILKTEKSAYISWMKALGFEVQQIVEEEGWLAFSSSSHFPSRKGSTLRSF